MGYYSDDITDKELKKLEREIAGIYKEAYTEMTVEADKYFKTLEKRYEKEYQAYQEGKYTDDEFRQWYRTQVERGNGYYKMRDELASRATNANMVASSYINDKTPSIYSLNYRYETYEIQQGSGVSYHAYDEQTIKNLLMGDENVVEFRTTSVSPSRDYEWNRKQIERALTAGILQGKSIDKLSESFLTVMKRNKASAIRNARTSFTSAQNAGRQMGYNQAKQMGLDFEKEWIATLDERTRISHGLLDGKRVPHDKPFSNGLMYPADSSGAPAEVYNCRCTMRAVFKGINDQPRQTYSEWRIRQDNDEVIDAMPKIKPKKPVISLLQFTPSKTVQEAEKYISKYVDTSEFGSVGLSYKGMSIDVVNEVNRVLTNFFEDYDVGKLAGISAPAKNTKLGKIVVDRGIKAGYMPVRNSLIFDRDVFKSIKTAEAQLRADNVMVKKYLDNPNNFDLSKLSKEVANVLTNSKTSGRGMVCDTIEDAINHEMGHFLAHHADFSDIMGGKDIYASKISGYACRNESEYIAESFASYRKGEGIIDPLLESKFEMMRK